jgi:oxygen-dependent protoporphyrinogen oxidase
VPLPETPQPPRIAIIGGGISGLASARRLTELLPNASLTLFEAADRLGGVLDTVERDGFLIERSADNFLTQPPAAAELCRRLGMADELLPTNHERRRAFVVRDGRLLPIPDGFYLMSPRKLGPLLASPLLSWPAKLRLLAEPFIPRRKRSPSGKGQGEDTADESVADFACRRLGREAFEQIIQPLVAGIYTADPHKLSMAATMPQFVEMERTQGSLLRATLFHRRTGHFSDKSNSESIPQHDADQAAGPRYALFTAPKRGMKSLITALAASGHHEVVGAGAIQLNTRVSSISRESNQWQLDFGFRISDCGLDSPNPQLLSFDALLLAVPAHAAARLLESTASDLAAELAAISYASCAVISLGFARRQIGHALDGFGFVVPQREGRRIIAASFASLKYPGRAPSDCVLIRTFIGGALQPELLQLPDTDLIDIAIEELSELLSITGEPLVTDVARWPHSMPQYHVGHLDRARRIEQLVARLPNLALAGNAYHGVGIPQCVASGQAAAEHIAAQFPSPGPSEGPGEGN